MPRPNNRGSMDPTRKEKAYKYSRVDGSKIGHTDFYVQKEKCAVNSSQNGQHGCPKIPSENGGHHLSGDGAFEQTDLGVPSRKSDHTYDGISSQLNECRGGQRVQECEGLERVETQSAGISAGVSKKISARNRSICLKSIETDPKIQVLEEGPLQ